MVRLANVRMRSMLLLVQFLSTCSGIEFEPPEEYSCDEVARNTSGTSGMCTCDVESGTCTLSFTLSFGEAELLFKHSGLKAHGLQVDKFDMLGFNGLSPGPTIRVRAGDTLKILLKNNLQAEAVSTKLVPNNEMREFDVVNLHTHGLHVSPLAPADDVIVTQIAAQGQFQYEYHIPVDHMGGTHWYHAHWHGAVSIHVNFGAAGMLIVEDAVNQLPMELASVEDYIVAAFHVDFNDITRIKDTYVANCKKLHNGTQSCDGVVNCEGKVGKECQKCTDPKCVNQANIVVPDVPGSDKDVRLLLVNGQSEPTLTIAANTWVRLRLGFMATGMVLAPKLFPFGCQMLLLAKDGVYLPIAPRAITQGLLASGNRADVLINCPKGEFTLDSTEVVKSDGKLVANVIDDVNGYPFRLLHINSVVDEDVSSTCTLPVFEVNRPCYLVNLREQEVAKNLTFYMAGPTYFYGIANATAPLVPPDTEFSYDPNVVGYKFPVGEVVGLDLKNVNRHPFHIHINPFQLTKNGTASEWEKDWFNSGDWHDTMFNPDDGTQRVLMQTDYFNGPTVVHCHILEHEDQGMMVRVNFTGSEGSRYPPAYGVSLGSGETCRAHGVPLGSGETCSTTPLIDRKCYSGLDVMKPTEVGRRIGTCPSPPPPPPNAFVFKAAAATAVAATATAEANTWKVIAIVLGVVLAAVLLLVAAVFLAMRGTANSGAAAGGAEAGGAEMM